ncbi:MAG: histidine kinase [Clostridiaceae bacterium]|nr:histidine kinase [Clostridiaceae bacterium]
MDRLNYLNDDVNSVLTKVILEIDSGKDKILKISDTLRSQYIKEKIELEKVNNEIEEIICKVDFLEKQDKIMRKKLAGNFKILDGNEARMERVYKEALEVRVEYISAQKEEQKLQMRRENLQRSIKSYEDNIQEAETVAEQVSIALRYLNGDLYKKFEDFEDENKLTIGIKMVQVEEKVRNRIAREIHDGPAQYLASIVMMIDFCKNILEKDVQRGLDELTSIQDNVKKTLKEVRSIIFDLRPPFMEGISLKEAFEDLEESFQDESNITLKSEYKDINCELDVNIKTTIYRIVQELLSNIKKHSQGTEAYLRIEMGNKNIYITAKDNGIGFDYDEEKIKNNKRYGLQGMFNRIEELNGVIKVKSSVGKGTEYKIVIPRSGRR